MSTVGHPPHYNQVPGVECIDVVEHFNFNRGNAIKYLWRSGAKGNEMEDLKKAEWYVRLRLDPHAQWEIRQYAQAICKLIEPIVPVAYAAWMRTRETL